MNQATPSPEEEKTLRKILGLPTDPDVIVRLESENGLRQFDAAIQLIEQVTKAGMPFVFRPSLFFAMNRLAIEGVDPFAGCNRPWDVRISNSPHVPPPHSRVMFLMEQLCDHLNQNRTAPSLHRAAFILWRLNWIHPFCNGNGRTSRIMCYVALSIGYGVVLPGETTIPELIATDKAPYYEALRKVDASLAAGKLDLAPMERYLEALLIKQLETIKPPDA